MISAVFSAQQHIAYIHLERYMLSPVRLSACLFVTRVYHTKTAEVRIMKFSPYGSPVALVLRSNFHPEILTGQTGSA